MPVDVVAAVADEPADPRPEEGSLPEGAPEASSGDAPASPASPTPPEPLPAETPPPSALPPPSVVPPLQRPLVLLAMIFGPLGLLVAGLLAATAKPPAPPAEASAPAVSHPADGGADGGDAPANYKPRFRVADLSSDERYKVIEAKVGHQPFLSALRHAGVGAKGAARLLEAFKGVKSLDRLHDKDVFRVALTKDGNVLEAFELETSPSDIWQARTIDGALTAEKLELMVEHHRTARALVVKDDIKGALAEAGLDGALLDRIEDGLEGHVDVAALKPGSRLRLLFTTTVVDGRPSGRVELDAVEYLSPKAHATPLRFYRGPGHAPGYYDGKGQQPYTGGYRSPIPFAAITSRFNPHRMHPVLHVVKPHNGVDYAASVGTPVYAVAPGTIHFAADSGPCGNMVQIAHPGGLITAYCHLSRFGKIHVGQHVEGRQLIGYAGQTGRATGPHLHFAVKKGDKFIDPLSLKMDGVRTLPASERAAFEERRDAWNAELDALPLPGPLGDSKDAKEEDEEILGDEDDAPDGGATDAAPPP